MIKIICALLCTAVVCVASIITASARDNLPIGYTAITGIKAGLWVAEEAGIFEKYNIQPHLILITSGSKMVQAMLGGDLPLAGAAGNAAVDAALAGADIVMIGALAKVPAFYIMALPEIKSIEDLRGKPVAVTRFGSSTDFTMRYLLRKHGMNPDRDVTMVQTGDIFAAAAMMKTKAIVAAPFSSPANLRAQEAGARVLMNMGKAGIYFPHDAWMASRSYINANEDLIRRFMKGYSEGVAKLFSDPDLSRRAIRRFTRATDPKIVDAVYQYAVDYVEKIPYNTREGIQEVLNQAAARNPKAKDAKPEAFYDDRFVKELDSQGFYKQLWK
ncbi:MAG TPA: ABC transporter substrate-binding protein [Candidatus Binatia bacterium]|jgi:NitT/TauT family transport system substrate-binding protein|nr:ABC transporter substrate-binding protein [Candidatus Binatia bacterium]